MNKILASLLLIIALPTLGAESAGVSLDTDQKKVSYAIGMSTAQSIARQGVDIDLTTYMLGVRDALDGTKPRLTPDQAAKKREKDSLLLSRNGVLQQIQSTRNSRHKKMLEAALSDLDAKLSQI